MFITELDSEFDDYINKKKLSEKEKREKINKINEESEKYKRENKKISSKKSKITKDLNAGKIHPALASKQYRLLENDLTLNNLRIKELEEQTKIINDDADARIEINGLFTRTFVKKSYLIKLKSIASYILKNEINEIENIMSNPKYKDLKPTKRKGIEAQYERMKSNLKTVQEGLTKNEYPIQVVVTPTKIVLL